MRIRSAAERDEAMQKHLAANEIIDDETGEPWAPEVLPADSEPDTGDDA